MFSKLSLESKQTNDALSGSQVQRVSDESVNYFERNSGIDSNEADEMVKSDARCIDDVQTNSDRSMLTDAAQSTADETTQELTCESQELDCLIAEGLSNDDIVGKLTCEIFLRLLAYWMNGVSDSAILSPHNCLKLQTAPAWNLVGKCSLAWGWCLRIFYRNKLIANEKIHINVIFNALSSDTSNGSSSGGSVGGEKSLTSDSTHNALF